MASRRKRQAGTDPVSRGSTPPPKGTAIPIPKGPKGWARAAEVLDLVRSVQSIFLDFNRATRVGGLPVGRIHTVHGPTHGGKTAFALGLLKSFLDAGHASALVDAEHATPLEFAREMIGPRADDLLAMRPDSYEETIEAVDDFLKHVRELRKDRPELCSIVVVDSINKLVPKRELEKILKEGGDEIAKGHSGRYRAALNQGWLDHLVPMLADAACALVLIAQERDDPDSWMDDAAKPKGGRALEFDASLLIQVAKAQPIFDPPSERKEANIVGFGHRVRIRKNKVGHLDGRHTDCAFHISNGKACPAGFDLARDAVAVGCQLGVVQLAGSWLTWRRRRWQGVMRAVQQIGADAELLRELMVEVNAAVDAAAGRVAPGPHA